jgi:hypothetical protein
VQVNGIRLANITNLELTHGKRTWQVRGGERSTQIQHWIWEEERVRVGQDGQPVQDSQSKEVRQRPRSFGAPQSDYRRGLQCRTNWVQILTDTPKEILYAAADAERISEYILTIEQKKEPQHTQEVGVRKDIPYAERTYLAVPYAEREEAKALRSTLGCGEEKLVRGSGSGSRKNCEMGPETSSCAHAGSTDGIRGGAARDRGCR